MSQISPTLALPYLMPAQAQKHVTHNEALAMLDLLVQSVAEALADTPPAAPAEGAAWLVGAAPTGAWAGHEGALAQWRDGAWAFAAPRPGWRVWDRDAGALRIRTGSDWAVLESLLDLQNLGHLGINTGADAVNRLSLASAASLFSHDGAGHQVKVNKAAAGDTASFLFQTGYSGRAEIGLAGNDAFSLKVSADGATWATALVAAPSGAVGIGSLLRLAPQAAAPASPAAGDIYFDAGTGKLRCHDGSTWWNLF